MTTMNDEEVLKPLLDRQSRDRVRLVCKVLDRLPDLLDMLDKSREILEMADGSAIEKMNELVKDAEGFRDEAEGFKDECYSLKEDIEELKADIVEGREG